MGNNMNRHKCYICGRFTKGIQTITHDMDPEFVEEGSTYYYWECSKVNCSDPNNGWFRYSPEKQAEIDAEEILF